jgi:hypothetical protein
MKTLISNMILLTVSLLTPQIAPAQGTVYISNVGQPSTGSEAAGSDSWLAAEFRTGNNASGYIINSIQLGMLDAAGNPSDLTVMIYTDHVASGEPGFSLGTLDGSSNPTTAGNYTYTDDSNIILSHNTQYFIVLTSGTTVADGAYNWSFEGANSYNLNGGWSLGTAPIFLTSNDGSSWNRVNSVFAQFSITATLVPEPSPSLLFLLESGIFIYVRRAFRI